MPKAAPAIATMTASAKLTQRKDCALSLASSSNPCWRDGGGSAERDCLGARGRLAAGGVLLPFRFCLCFVFVDMRAALPFKGA
jgi:hypothetical protein